MDLKGKKILLIGLGEKTGINLLRYLVKVGSKVFVTEKKTRDELLNVWNQVSGLDAEFEFGGHSIDKASGVELAILCPGVPVNSIFVKAIKEKGIEVISELEFSYRILKPKGLIAVTGTNGKSTTVTLLGEMLKRWGREVFVGGNLGTPLIEAAISEIKYDYYVVEVSSFQLEAVTSFKPKVAALTNISKNHLDRHASMEEYISIKSRIFKNQEIDDYAVINLDDSNIDEIKVSIPSEIISFSLSNKKGNIYFEKGKIYSNKLDGVLLDLNKCNLPGTHNVYNIMCAAICAITVGCPTGHIQEAINSYEGLSHRIEYLGEIDGVEYFDDSKSTTVESTKRALESMSGKTVLIAGGQNKGSDFRDLKECVKKNAKCLVLYGEAASVMNDQLYGACEIHVVSVFDDAVKKASQLADRGESVLLSPANSSFDQFRNYKERGARFKGLFKRFRDAKK